MHTLRAKAVAVKPRPAAGRTVKLLTSEPNRMTQDRQLDPDALGDHIDRLYRAAWGLCGSREEAEDLVQETFARVLRKPRILHSDDDLGYLLRVLRNTYFSSRRAAARRPQTTPLPTTSTLWRIATRSIRLRRSKQPSYMQSLLSCRRTFVTRWSQSTC
jgi:DNA-directed RNA polymerase specialized sigma24 family protein